jgi:hypothetical protein
MLIGPGYLNNNSRAIKSFYWGCIQWFLRWWLEACPHHTLAGATVIAKMQTLAEIKPAAIKILLATLLLTSTISS